MTDTGPVPLCSVCPKCGGRDTAPTFRTPAGAHCKCHACGHVWLDEDPYPRRAPDRRRKTSY